MDPRPEWRCRIGKVTRKDGRGSVRVLHPDGIGPSKVLAKYQEHVPLMAEDFMRDAAGYVIVMWGRSGSWNRCWNIGHGSPFGPGTVAGVVHSILLQDAAREVTHGVLRGDPE